MPATPWYLLIHRIPATPLYLRARVRQRLERIGAVALKQAVYALPQRSGALERLRAVAEEIRERGGEAFVCEARFTEEDQEAALVEAFREHRRRDYARLAEVAAGLATGAPAAAGRRSHARLRRDLERVAGVDFFEAEGRRHAEGQLSRLERRVGRGGGPRSPWRGRTWVTRRGVHVDRIACAWFIRRFLDPAARFRFVGAEGGPPRPGEVGFDLPGGEFSHRDGGCSLETLIAATGVRDPALQRIAEIVHDLDLKDGKFGHPESAGVERLLAGMIAAHPRDAARLERGAALLDDLHRAWSKAVTPPPGLAPASRRPARGQRA